MTRELDFVEGDWAALSWALGSAAAVFGPSARGLASGVALAAGVFLVSAAGLLRVLFLAFPAWRGRPAPLVEWFTAIALPEIVFVAAAVLLWRQRRSVAAGVVLTAITLMIHFVVHVTL